MCYEPNPDPNTLFQGDVLANFILPDPPDKALIARSLSSDPSQNPSISSSQEGDVVKIFSRNELTDAFSNNREAILVTASLTAVAVISQSCDVQRKTFLTVAAVSPMGLIQGDQKKSDIRSNDRKFEYFGLPPTSNFEESFVDLTLLYSVRREHLISQLSERILSMNSFLRQNFQWAIIRYFGRPAG